MKFICNYRKAIIYSFEQFLTLMEKFQLITKQTYCHEYILSWHRDKAIIKYINRVVEKFIKKGADFCTNY